MGHRHAEPDEPETDSIRKKNRRLLKRKELTLSKTFTAFFLDDADSRLSVVRTIRRRIERLKEEAGATSYQREILCQRAVFIAVLLETAETKALEGEPFDMGSYVQMVNSLSGLLKSLGLDKKAKNVTNLRSYLAERSGAA